MQHNYRCYQSIKKLLTKVVKIFELCKFYSIFAEYLKK